MNILKKKEEPASEKRIFFVNELRRNYQLFLPCTGHDFKSKYFLEKIDKEYAVYFGDKKKLDKISKAFIFYKKIFGGCSTEIEHGIVDAGLFSELKKLSSGSGELFFEPEREINGAKICPDILKLLIGRGYLFPIGDEKYVIHRNLVAACAGVNWFADSPFNRRDSARCPWLYKKEIPKEDMWNYFCDLTALDFSDIGSYNNCYHFVPDMFYGRKTEDKKLYSGYTQIITYKVPKYLEYGRMLVPQRYCEKEPKIENFDWKLMPLFKERFAERFVDPAFRMRVPGIEEYYTIEDLKKKSKKSKG